ncbi:MAG: hypothetical protein GOU98_03680 [Candidatus Altiarchaeota archaeon]|nr:hypothetical protein [Candidatus Altiarchaeota archaeon]
MGRLNQIIETKVQSEITAFLTDFRKISPHKLSEAQRHWNDYKPELLKCESKDEAARLILAFFQRELKAIKDETDAKVFHRFKYDTVGKLQKCLYALRVHKNALKDYTKYLHSIKGKELERGIRMADEKPWETPDEVEKVKVTNPINTKEMRKRHGSSKKQKLHTLPKSELLAAGGFAISFVVWLFYKIFT